MNCEQACELIALAASGDVTAAEQASIAAHVADCPACRDEAAAFSVLTSQLSAMRGDAVPDYVFAAVRAQVASEISRRARPAWLTAWPAFAAVVACGITLVVLLRPEARRVEKSVRSETPAIAMASPPVEAPAARASVRRIAKPASPGIQKPAEPLVVQMFTDDPEVVIYWIADARTDRAGKELIQ